MKLLLAAVMLSILAGCVMYDDGHRHRHRHGGDGWYSQGNDNDQGHHHHRSGRR